MSLPHASLGRAATAPDKANAAAGPSVADIGRKVDFLGRAAAHPGRPSRVDAIETHMSWVFLAGDRVLKLKKPVRYDFLDFSTLDARRHSCMEEVRLNRRLAPDVYLGVVPLTQSPDGSLSLNGAGAVVDWLVAMKRLPKAAQLNVRLRRGEVTAADIERIAAVLAVFFRDAAPASVGTAAYRDRFLAAIAREREVLLDPGFGLPVGRITFVADAARRFVDSQGALLDRRALEGRIVEGHGDLRPEHIFLMPEPVIIDCLEFNRELRILDPVEELAYLAMECTNLGARWVADALFAAYARHSADRAPDALIAFYGCERALLRARLAILHLRDEVVPDAAKWIRQALDYLELAAEKASELPNGD